MDGINYDICMTQARLYRYVANDNKDVKEFSDKYLNSDFCRRAMDCSYSRFQLETELECLDFILPEIGEISSNYHCDPDIAAWIGFTYRQLAFDTGKSSKELCALIPFDIMTGYYPGMHTVDEDMASEIICKNHNLERENTRE